MTDKPEQVRMVIAAAEQAAGAGDFELASRHLREAVTLQEAIDGPVHPDLANTLNNLGVACEQSGQLDAAEAAYRRAYAVALKAFEPGHPFVQRSAENLRDFCAARGRPFGLPESRPPNQQLAEPASVTPVPGPSPAPAELSPPRVPSPPTAVPSSVPASRRVEASPAAASASWNPRFIVVPTVVSVLLVVFGLWWWGRGPDTTLAPRADPAATAPIPSAAPRVPAAVAPASIDPAPPVAESAPTAPPAATAPIPSAAPVELVGNTVGVATARMCRAFTPTGPEWQCEPVGAGITPGRPLVYYTRVRSPRNTTIEHVWYRDDVLHQRVALDIVANPGAGYRTYSRTTAAAGNWHVELRSGDQLLDEQRFTVR